jgi:hypothetical protein
MVPRALRLALALALASARNPIVPGVGMADPHVHLFNGTYYVYATHDFSANNTGFLMKDWFVWSSPDLVSWAVASVLPPANTSSTSPTECWATDTAARNGAYFWYLSFGLTAIGVVTGPSPAGPWTDPLGAPLVSASAAAALRTQMRDPCAFVDDDGSAYLVAGWLDYKIARLNEDMVSFAEPWRNVSVLHPTGPGGPNSTDDKPFIFKRGGTYYLSWGCFYATSASVYGPYGYVGSVIDTAAIAPAFRMNDTAGPWYARKDYAGRHGSFWGAAGQWFFATTDWSHSTDAAHPNFFRDTVIGYVHFYANGSIAPVAIDETGVGEYDGARVEAENAMALAGAARKAHAPARGGAFVVAVDGPSAALAFPRVRAAQRQAPGRLTLVAANAGAHNATIVARRGSAGGAVLAACVVPPSRGEFRETACAADVAAGDEGGVDVHLAFDGGDAPMRLELDAFTLTAG